MPAELISAKTLAGFADHLCGIGLKRSSIKLILGTTRQILRQASFDGDLQSVPPLPVLKGDSIPRGGFSVFEYLHLWHTAKRLVQEPTSRHKQTHRDVAGGLFARDHPLMPAMPHLIRFMVNSFIRPTDLRWMQHKHIQVCRGRHIYLRMELPESKRHATQIVSMPSAVMVYERILDIARAQDRGGPEDYVFLPEVANRKSVMVLIDLHFRRVLEASGLRVGKRGQNRTLYSLRHTAITFRLLYGRGIDLLTLARNARTSVEMIERFYASELSAEMNVAMLHSRRSG